MIVHRITGDGPIDLMIGPMWSVNKWEVLNGIDAELESRGSWQGKLLVESIVIEMDVTKVKLQRVLQYAQHYFQKELQTAISLWMPLLETVMIQSFSLTL